MPSVIDQRRSRIEFSVRHLMVSKVRGRFSRFEGMISIPDDSYAKSSVQVTIDAASIETGDSLRDAFLRDQLLDVARFPSLTYASTRVEVDGRRLRVHGALTIRDVTREVLLDAEPLGGGRYRARAAVDRKLFGLDFGALLDAGALLVGDRVDVDLEVAS
jgi:polyisoprenoid-binding protein YceI